MKTIICENSELYEAAADFIRERLKDGGFNRKLKALQRWTMPTLR